MIEVNTAILCASVPALKPLFTPHRMRDFRRQEHYRFQGDDPLSTDSQSQIQKRPFSRKQSSASAYPDLEMNNMYLKGMDPTSPRQPPLTKPRT